MSALKRGPGQPLYYFHIRFQDHPASVGHVAKSNDEVSVLILLDLSTAFGKGDESLFFEILYALLFPGGSVGKESACHAEDQGSIPGLGRSPGEGKGYPSQCSGLENSMDNNSPWGCKELEMIERLSLSLSQVMQVETSI